MDEAYEQYTQMIDGQAPPVRSAPATAEAAPAFALPAKIDIADAFANEPPALDFVVPGLIAGTVGSIVAPGSSGKSYLAVELALAVGAGVDITGGAFSAPGQATGRVVYMPAEDPPAVIKHRLHTIGAHLPASSREVAAEQIDIMPLAGQMPHLLDSNGKIGPDQACWIEAIKSAAQGARLLIIDTLRRYHAADENDNGAMSVLLQVLEQIATELDTTIVFIHHTSKAAAVGLGDAQTASRGAGALTDNGRWQINLVGMKADEAELLGVDPDERGRFVRVVGSKINYGEGRADHWLRRAKGGVLVPAVFDPAGVVRARRRKDGPDLPAARTRRAEMRVVSTTDEPPVPLPVLAKELNHEW